MILRKIDRRLLWVPWLLLILGLLLTFLLQAQARTSAQQVLHDRFEFRANEVAETIRRRLGQYEQMLAGAVGLFAASESVERGEFAAYVRALRMEERFPGIQGIGFSRWIPAAGKARHVASVRAEGFPNYSLRPEGVREAYTAILYLEPFDWRNQRAFGYDMYSEPVRRAAMALARDSQQTTISGKVRLVQETEQDVQPGFLMYLPVYRNGSLHGTPEERRAALVGWVYAPFRMRDLMAGVLGQHFGEITATLDLEVYDGAGVTPAAKMFDSSEAAEVVPARFEDARTVTFFGRDWTILLRSRPAFEVARATDKANLIALTGVVVSALLALLAWVLVTARARAVVLAEGMTVELRESEARQRKLNRALRMLSDCNLALMHAQDEYRLLSDICRLIVERGGYRMAWVGQAEHDEVKTVRPIAQFGYEEGYLEKIGITWADTELGRGPTGTAIRTGVTVVNPNIMTNPRMAPWRAAAVQRGYQSSIALPLIHDAQVLGALMLYATQADAFGVEEVRLLEELAGDLAYGIASLRTRAAHEAAKENLAFLVQFDALTHLPNRVLLRDRFEQALRRARDAGHGVALLYLDLDNFRQVNDSLGIQVGDQVLVAVVERLRGCTVVSDTLSRLTGDEFVLILSEVHSPADVILVTDRIQQAFAEPLRVGERSVDASFSIGISLFPEDGSDFDSLLKSADTAVGSAKEAGRRTYRFFTRTMNQDAQTRIQLAGQLQDALRRGEFFVQYQPQAEVGTGRIVAAEALVGWNHPVEGAISPGRFIPLAEQCGHIVQIGEWVLREACREARRWMAQGASAPTVSVNVSVVQLRRGNVFERVQSVLAESGLPPQCLELELTESILLEGIAPTMETLRQLKTLGVRIAIDDFGTGYSSLSYLKQLAVDKLKIDQSFVRDMMKDAVSASIVKAIIELGHSLGLVVLAEGVETVEQWRFLKAAGCDEVQGHVFSRAVSSDRLIELMRSPPAIG